MLKAYQSFPPVSACHLRGQHDGFAAPEEKEEEEEEEEEEEGRSGSRMTSASATASDCFVCVACELYARVLSIRCGLATYFHTATTE